MMWSSAGRATQQPRRMLALCRLSRPAVAMQHAKQPGGGVCRLRLALGVCLSLSLSVLRFGSRFGVVDAACRPPLQCCQRRVVSPGLVGRVAPPRRGAQCGRRCNGSPLPHSRVCAGVPWQRFRWPHLRQRVARARVARPHTHTLSLFYWCGALVAWLVNGGVATTVCDRDGLVDRCDCARRQAAPAGGARSTAAPWTAVVAGGGG